MTTSLRPRIRYRLLRSLEEFRQTTGIQRETWGSAEIVLPEVMVASSHAGGFAVGALERERLVGFAYALAGWQDKTRIFWSHMLAVEPGWRNAGIGERLKWLQRKVALARGAKLILWSFDPLEGRNAWLNLRKLGCLAAEYIPNLYGPMASKLEGGLETDRLIASWYLDSARVSRLYRDVRRRERARGEPAREPKWVASRDVPLARLTPLVPLVPLVNDTRTVGGVLRCGRLRLGLQAPAIRVEIPSDIQPIKQHYRNAAKEWRVQMRRALMHYLRRGYVVADFWRGKVRGKRKSYYLLVRGNLAAVER